MPRVNGVMQLPPGTYGVPGTKISSAKFNTFADDVVADANAARPVTAGGTGATNTADAKANLAINDGGAASLATTMKSTHADGTLVNFETSGVVTGSFLASGTGLTIGTGPSGRTLQLLDTGDMRWSGNRFRMIGASPGIEFIESDFSTDASYLFMNGNTLRYQNATGGEVFSITSVGQVNASKVVLRGTGTQVDANTNGGYAVSGVSADNHAIFGRTFKSGQAGIIGQSANGDGTGFLGLDTWGVYSSSATYSAGGYQSSDERLKENIADAQMGDILDLIQRLRVVEFDWRKNTDAYNIGKRRTVGLIAQEVEGVLPQIILPVTAPAPMDGQEATLNQQLGEFLSIDSNPLIYYLLAAVQQLAKQSGLGAVKTYKADVRRRMTSDENDTFTAALEGASSLLRGLWYDVQYLDHAAPEFADFRDAVAAAFGADRADEILAPSV